jgi:hypothetical protein
MQIRTTNKFKRKFNSDKLNKFITRFKEWKSGDEYGSFHFGKDAPYETPLVNGVKNVLKHAHLPPPSSDRKRFTTWVKNFKLKSRKTSGSVLVYRGREDYLLIDIIDERDAHDIAKMKNEKDRKLMNYYAKIADDFIYQNIISE